MSSNKGKDGEMRIIKIVADIYYCERPSFRLLQFTVGYAVRTFYTDFYEDFLKVRTAYPTKKTENLAV
ncbi:hypothetical protein AADEFJLK_01130 [Methylovulum psychrotolerans]|uniref:Uncharacterized protein n=1 Tax=Methylovulum psychrotolerans TaxID=1704499 RepID=A0A2S5CTM8_9GAMM|nr:hypothetical protein AADEFJLK_01130 [Methylovulum psychrotolerans]